MKTLYMKIVGYDERSNSLLVCFASDTTKHQDPECYPSQAFQPAFMWPDIIDVAEIHRRIAMAGVYQVEQQEREERLADDPVRQDAFRALVGSSCTFNKEELVPSIDDTPGVPMNTAVVVV